MNKIVVLELDGDLEHNGFQATLHIGEEGKSNQFQTRGSLPPNPNLAAHLEEHWHRKYRTLADHSRLHPQRIIRRDDLISQCQASAQQLSAQLKTWLQSPSFHELDLRLREQLSPHEPIRFLLATENQQLHKLPWQEWDFFERYQSAELALSTRAFELPTTSTIKSPQEKINILAILGHHQGIDIEIDRQKLENLPQAQITFLSEPSRQELSEQLWSTSWQILFFAGHSETKGDSGVIYLNPEESLSLEELKYALRKAIAGGLQLAIFNSCDGLGLAQQLKQLHLPQMIVMREPIPDQVAHQFLQYFLQAYAQGSSLYLAQREAREKLQALEADFPCASWLPVICQNPAALPPTWLDLSQPTTITVSPQQQKFQLSPKQLATGLMISVIVSTLVMVIRYLGLLQGWELAAFDQLMRTRPRETQDSRILIITVTPEDVHSQPSNERRSSLTDTSLHQLLTILEQAQPRVIGLDIYRDYPVLPQYPELAQQLAHTKQLFAICKIDDAEGSRPEILPPPEIPSARLGFSDMVLDHDLIVRRHLLALEPASGLCQTAYALNMKLALAYLQREGMEVKFPDEHTWQLSSARFSVLEAHQGGYQNIDTRGHQILLNYRWHGLGKWESLFEQVTLTEVLEGKVSLEALRGRVVLIGTTDPSYEDYVRTPYLNKDGQPIAIPGVIMQAQMTSQIISAALDGRKLLWASSSWLEWGWTIVWSVIGVGVISTRKSLLYCLGTGCLVLMGLWGASWLLLVLGGVWIPGVSAAIALIVSAIVFKYYYGK